MEKKLTIAQQEHLRELILVAEQANKEMQTFYRYLLREHEIGDGWNFDQSRMMWVKTEESK